MLQSEPPATCFHSVLFVAAESECFIYLFFPHPSDSHAMPRRGGSSGGFWSRAMWAATAMTAVALVAWYGGVNSSSAFNLSMQVLRFVTFTPCGSPLPLSASDRCGVELSNMYCVCRKCAFILRERVVVCFNCATLCVRVCVLLVLWMKRSHSVLVQETRFDTSIVKITCVQTVIVLQTIRTAITHF